jgi:hypothetical protein
VTPLSSKARRKILVLSQFDLQLSFPCPGSFSENIQDEGNTIQYFDSKGVFKISLLKWLQFVVKYY